MRVSYYDVIFMLGSYSIEYMYVAARNFYAVNCVYLSLLVIHTTRDVEVGGGPTPPAGISRREESGERGARLWRLVRSSSLRWHRAGGGVANAVTRLRRR